MCTNVRAGRSVHHVAGTRKRETAETKKVHMWKGAGDAGHAGEVRQVRHMRKVRHMRHKSAESAESVGNAENAENTEPASEYELR